jgi:6-phosphofructokinase 2
MSKIITLTLSPSVDKSTMIDSLEPEKKLKCTTPKLEPGGGGINIARVLKELKTDAIAVFPSGGNMGKLFNELLEKEKVPALIINTKHETRENFVVQDKSTGQQFRFVMPANKLAKSEWNACLEAIKNIDDISFIVVSGSLPPGVPLTILEELAEISKRKKAKFIVDTSGPALKNIMTSDVFLLKPNLTELAYLSGRKTMTASDAEQAAKDILALGKCEIMIISLGSQGALLVTKNQSFTVKPPTVLVKSTVGAGDSMVAGIVHALSTGMNLKNALEFSVACGTAATMNYGTSLCHKKDVESLFKEISNRH